jgi:hypothetical protein
MAEHPIAGKIKTATIIDPAMAHIEWGTAEILMNSDAKRQMYI